MREEGGEVWGQDERERRTWLDETRQAGFQARVRVCIHCCQEQQAQWRVIIYWIPCIPDAIVLADKCAESVQSGLPSSPSRKADAKGTEKRRVEGAEAECRRKCTGCISDTFANCQRE